MWRHMLQWVTLLNLLRPQIWVRLVQVREWVGAFACRAYAILVVARAKKM